MENIIQASAAADRPVTSQLDRAEKGSAMRIIRAETDASHAKSARLKALRLARDAESLPALPKKPARKPSKS